MKKLTLALSGILLFVAIVAMKPKTINIPPDHGTTGTLHPPIALDPDVPIEIWTINNNSDCDITIAMWFTVDANNNPMHINVDLTSGSSHTFSSADILKLFNLNSTTNLTHSSMNILQYQSSTQISVVYPGDYADKPGYGLEEGCTCVHVDWNTTTRIITISNC